MTYFTSDQHFGHFNIIRLCQRPFGSLEEMDAVLLERWNAKVKPDDVVYVLGDLFFRCAAPEPILKALGDYFESVQTLKEVEIDGRILTLCHYPMLSYPQARRGFMVYGHIHNSVHDDYWPLIARRSRMFNAGVDVNNFEPVGFDELVENNRRFIERHQADAKADPLSLFCGEA